MRIARNIAAALIVSAMTIGANAQTYTNQYRPELVKLAQKWVKKGEWRNGFVKASPAKQMNVVEFYLQYQKNPEQWKALFEWLQNNDLLAVPGGKIPIEGTELTVSVEDSENRYSEQDLNNGKGSESHERKIDFMYVVKGTEGFALLDHDSSKDNGYNDKKDRHEYQFDANKLKHFESIPDTFMVMFPCDWHIAKVRTKLAEQGIRVLVIKVNYKL